jgi:hypothetical protein
VFGGAYVGAVIFRDWGFTAPAGAVMLVLTAGARQARRNGSEG